MTAFGELYDDLHVRLEIQWFLSYYFVFCSSIGLNMNSTAVIIGAMLISLLWHDCWTRIWLAIFDTRLISRGFTYSSIGQFTYASTLSGLLLILCKCELIARTSNHWDVLIAVVGYQVSLVQKKSKQYRARSSHCSNSDATYLLLQVTV